MYSSASYSVWEYVLRKNNLTTMYVMCNCENNVGMFGAWTEQIMQGTCDALEPCKWYSPKPLIWLRNLRISPIREVAQVKRYCSHSRAYDLVT